MARKIFYWAAVIPLAAVSLTFTVMLIWWGLRTAFDFGADLTDRLLAAVMLLVFVLNIRVASLARR